MHRGEYGAWWFSSDGSGRFDLESPDGTCYLAETPLGALIEHFDGIDVIPQEDLEERRISLLGQGKPLRLIDEAALHEAADTFGIQVVPLP